MPRMGGIELLEEIGTAAPNALTVIMTGFGTVETAIDAMKRGAYDYILKPFKVEEVIHVVQRGLEKQRLAAENLRLQGGALALQGERGHRREPLARRGARDGRRHAPSTRSTPTSSSTWLDDGEGGFFERQRLAQPADAGAPDARARALSTAGVRRALRAGQRRSSSTGTKGHALLRRTQPERAASSRSSPCRCA